MVASGLRVDAFHLNERGLPADEERWRAYLGRDDLDEPGEVVSYCPECAEREFKS
jgi:hypothetical protein